MFDWSYFKQGEIKTSAGPRKLGLVVPYLDGAVARHCLAAFAGDPRGLVVCYETDQEGQVVLRRGENEVRTVCLRGRVEIQDVLEGPRKAVNEATRK